MPASSDSWMTVPRRMTTPAIVTPSGFDAACISLTPMVTNPPSRISAADFPLTMMSRERWTEAAKTHPDGQVIEGVSTSPATYPVKQSVIVDLHVSVNVHAPARVHAASLALAGAHAATTVAVQVLGLPPANVHAPALLHAVRSAFAAAHAAITAVAQVPPSVQPAGHVVDGLALVPCTYPSQGSVVQTSATGTLEVRLSELTNACPAVSGRPRRPETSILPTVVTFAKRVPATFIDPPAMTVAFAWSSGAGWAPPPHWQHAISPPFPLLSSLPAGKVVVTAPSCPVPDGSMHQPALRYVAHVRPSRSSQTAGGLAPAVSMQMKSGGRSSSATGSRLMSWKTVVPATGAT